MKKFIYSILAIATVAAISASCSREEEDLFDKDSATRANEAIVAYNDILTAPTNGWLMEYFPEAAQSYGGYNHLLKFNEDGSVTAASEIFNSDYTATSLYKVQQSAGIEVSFDTYNEVFHIFADPSAPLAGDDGYGMEGDYDFQIISAEADKVVLKGRKSGSYAIMTPMSTSVTWEEYLDSIYDASTAMSYSSVVLSAGNDENIRAMGSYRTYTWTYYDADESAHEVTGSYIITPTGLRFYDQVDVNGITFQEFTFDTTEEVFTSVDDPKVTLSPYIAPLSEQFPTGDWFITYDNLSDWAKAKFDVADEAVYSGEGESVLYMAFAPGGDMIPTYNSNFGVFFYTDAEYAGVMGITVTALSDTQVSMKYTAGLNQGNGNYYINYCSFGSYLEVFGYSEAKTFDMETDNVKSPSYIKFTEVGNTDNYFTVEKDSWETYK